MTHNDTTRSSGNLATWKLATVIGLLAAASVGLATLLSDRRDVSQTRRSVDSAPAAPVAVTVEPPQASLAVRKAAFFDESVEPQIQITDQKNREAAERCLARLRGVIAGYRSSITPFVEDLTSLSTRLGIARRMPGSWWHSDDRIEVYVRNKFESHLFSQQSFSHDIASELIQFKIDVDANQNLLLSEVRAALDTSDLPDVSIDEYEPFFAAVSSDFVAYSQDQGITSVANFATVMVASEVGGQVFVRLVGGLLTRFAVSASLGAAASGGATVGGSTVGAGAGTLGGPVGAVVGFGVGLAVGLVIDWWMTDRFEQQLTTQMNAYLDQVEQAIMTDHPHGLSQTLPEVCHVLKDAYRERFYAQLVTP
ncbi:hypothetical protein Pla22_35320 [Rubripirellula amarantea]|uniref:Uncharacterized protein n=1 Tax=Rubripirellula amarantea TaxID=2527999 RepID=A0A5C5WL02_9BACT|nr:hypothetical protein [Rubripirellula amarantea]TWT50789.1 hypothetical protein Pla22_35320 [Rubripirellula amarantea]